jgi:hypothetical protein
MGQSWHCLKTPVRPAARLIGVKPIEVSVTKHEWNTLQYINIAMKNEQFIDDLPKQKMLILQFAMQTFTRGETVLSR